MTLILITIILAIGLIISIAFNYYQKNKINTAMQLLAMKNENIMLAIRAGNIAVWGFDVATGHLYNIEGEVFPEGGVNIEQAMSEVHPDEREHFGAILQEVARGVLPKEAICIRFRNMYTGEWEYIEKEFEVILSRTGEVETIIGTHKDVTKRVREAERIDELLTKYRKLYNENQAILNSLPVGVSIYNKDGDLMYFNHSICKMFQVRDSEMVYQAKINLWNHPYMGADLTKILDDKKDTIFSYQVDCSRLPAEYCIQSERVLNFSCYSNVVKNEADEVESYILLHRDITLQEEQARKMKDMSETLIRVIDASGFSVWEYPIKERKFYSYRGKICVENGTSYEDTIAAHTPESAQICEKMFHNLISGVSEVEHAIFETVGENKVGIKYFKCELVARKNADNEVDKIYGIEKEITDERNYQLELEESKLKTQLAIQTSDMVQWEYDVHKKTFYTLNEKGRNNVMKEEDYYRISHPDDLEKIRRIIEQMDAQVDMAYELDVRFKSLPDNEWQYVRINGTPLKHDRKGNVIKYTGFQRNNTQWHNLTEELKTTNKMNKQILDNMRSGLVYLTPEYEVIWENTSEKFSLDFTDGHKLFEIGKYCYQTHLGKDKICEKCVVEKVRAERRSFTIERMLSNGNVLEVIGNPIINEHDEFTGIILRLDDITERKKLYKELEKSRNEALAGNRLLREILDRVPGALSIKDPYNDYRYVIVNKVFCEIMEKTEAEIIGKTDFDLMLHEDAQRYRESDQVATDSMTTVTMEEETYFHNAYHCWKTIKAAFPYRDDSHLLISMSVNITEIRQTNYELQNAKERAEESDRLKSAFLANMTHEIRTPLNAIVGFSELLASSDSESEKQEYLRIISANNDLLLRLINDILDLSKLESGVVQLHDSKFDLVPYFNELAQSMQQRITNPAVEFIVVNPYERCIINADKERMAQVLLNYLTNAVKYTPSGFIKMGYEVIDDGVCIYVEDSGIGVPDDKKSKLFHRFEKLDSFAQGTGLGLSICKAITELNGGKVGFESTEGQGSRFWSWKPVVVDVVYKTDDV